MLKPKPISTRQLNYDAKTRQFLGEISDTQGFGRVWDDSVDEGLTLVSQVTGSERVFVVTDEVRDSEGDTLYWTLASVTNRRIDGELTIKLFND